MACETTITLAERGDLCGILSQLFLTGDVEAVVAPLAQDTEALAGLLPRTAAALAEGAQDDVVLAARMEYARLLCNGCVRGVHPFESVYRGKDHLLMEDPRDEVVAVYAGKGFAASTEPHLPEDHLSFELAFMQLLCSQDDDVAVEAFLAQHLGVWAPYFCNDLEALSEDPFWLDIAALVRCAID